MQVDELFVMHEFNGWGLSGDCWVDMIGSKGPIVSSKFENTSLASSTGGTTPLKGNVSSSN